METKKSETEVARRGEFRNGTHFVTIHPLPSDVGTYLLGKCASWNNYLEVSPHFREIERINNRIKDVQSWKKSIARARLGKNADPKRAISRTVNEFNELVKSHAYHSKRINEILKDEGTHVFHLVGQDGVKPGQVFSKIPEYAFMVDQSDLKKIEKMIKTESLFEDKKARESAFEIQKILIASQRSIMARKPMPQAR